MQHRCWCSGATTCHSCLDQGAPRGRLRACSGTAALRRLPSSCGTPGSPCCRPGSPARAGAPAAGRAACRPGSPGRLACTRPLLIHDFQITSLKAAGYSSMQARPCRLPCPGTTVTASCRARLAAADIAKAADTCSMQPATETGCMLPDMLRAVADELSPAAGRQHDMRECGAAPAGSAPQMCMYAGISHCTPAQHPTSPC